MSDEQKLHEDISAGTRAADALETMGSALDALEAEYVAGWRNTAARDTDARERLWQAVQIVGKVRTHLSKVAADGKLAEREVNEIRKFGERRKFLGVV
jgi:hypothetical protein